MAKSTPWLSIGKSYGMGYQAPSTAQFNTDKAYLLWEDYDRNYPLKLPEETPDFMEILFDIVPIPLDANPQVGCDGYERFVFDELLAKYKYAGVKLRATTIGRVKNQFVSLVGKRFQFSPEKLSIGKSTGEKSNDSSEKPIAFEFFYDNLTQNIFFDRQQGSVIWALGGATDKNMILDQYQQVFISFYWENDIIHHRISTLEDWWHKGIYPPFNMLPLTDPIPNARVQSNYKTLHDALCQGEMIFSLSLGMDNTGSDVGQLYQSIDAYRHGPDQVMVTFKRT